MAKFDMEWEAPEYHFREKGVGWYWISIIVAAVLIAFAVWQKDFLFGFFIVVAEILVIMWGDREPEMLSFLLTDEHIQVGDHKMHVMREFLYWSVDRNSPGWLDIHFYFRAKWRVPLRIIVPEERMEEFRANLKTVLKEIHHDMTFVDTIEKLIRF